MKAISIAALGFFLTLLLGCGSNAQVEVIDLNRVLDIMQKTLDDNQATRGAEFQGKGEDPEAQKAFMQSFNEQYAENLNAAKLMSQPIGTSVQADGSISGFVDPNRNMNQDAGEKQLFKVELDAERNRLIATDTQNGYHRDHGFSMSGLMVGMLIGHMLSGQRSAGITGSRFSNMKMSPKNYHSSAVQQARTSARAKSGSGSFARGK